MNQEITVGETATLKSGGPTMTVDAVGDHWGTQTAWCSWFDGKTKCNSTFPVSSLNPSE